MTPVRLFLHDRMIIFAFTLKEEHSHFQEVTTPYFKNIWTTNMEVKSKESITK